MTATMTAPGPVLVGVDGSTQNASAVAWAAAEASASCATAPLVLVHDVETAGPSAGRAILERATTEASSRYPQLTPSSELVAGGPAATLSAAAHTWERALERAPGTALVVVGRRGQGANRRISLGRTARTLTHQDGPALVVVPDGWTQELVLPDAPIVVDVGTLSSATVAAPDSQRTSTDRVEQAGQAGQAGQPDQAAQAEQADRALAFAVARALRNGHRVLAVASWSVPVSVAGQARAIREVWAEHADRARQVLEDLLAPWRTLYPEVLLTGVATDRSPVLALLAHAEGVELLVMPRGPRACAVMEYADGPVALV
ncbi:universal stress protein [Ornithinimicrobium sufpigmenti]|uniref:universal stress protein n=1 Tax=Ornithinimicrobium sufpigmenti TaxID=2508882 RepID=UPI00103596E1|nr:MULTISPECIES: universal stress protein [unclassified Ornithinimicrobium]